MALCVCGVCGCFLSEFQAANKADSKDNSSKQAYKCLDSLKKGFDKLVQLVEDMVRGLPTSTVHRIAHGMGVIQGHTRNEIRDLTSRIDALGKMCLHSLQSPAFSLLRLPFSSG